MPNRQTPRLLGLADISRRTFPNSDHTQRQAWRTSAGGCFRIQTRCLSSLADISRRTFSNSDKTPVRPGGQQQEDVSELTWIPLTPPATRRDTCLRIRVR
jgi:hypothetical protein